MFNSSKIVGTLNNQKKNLTEQNNTVIKVKVHRFTVLLQFG